MGQKDLSEKVLEDFDEVFADIYNILYFQNKFIDEKKLIAGPTESVYKAASEELRAQRRDVRKYYKKTCILELWTLGIENQSKKDNTMPVRLMGFDYSSYKNMLDNGKKIYPVITCVLNFSLSRWKKPLSLHDMMDIPEELKKYVQDYKIKVFDIAYLSDETIDMFQSDFKWIAKFFQTKRTGNEKELTFVRDEIQHIEAFLDMLAIFSEDDMYLRIKDDLQIQNAIKKGECVKVCSIVTTFMDMGREEGREEGRATTAKKLVEEGVDKSIIMKCTGYSAAELEALVTA